MILYYVRHGDPCYEPDRLTPLGRRQAEAVGRRLAVYGMDRVFSSPCVRARETARPLCELLHLEPTLLDFADENHAWMEFSRVNEEGVRWWGFLDPVIRRRFLDPEVRALGQRWYEHPDLAPYNFGKGMERIRRETFGFLRSLGYEKLEGTGSYRVLWDNHERIAFFAHQGMGLLFLSTLLEIPYPDFCMHFDMGHSGVTVLDFKNEDGVCSPRMLTLSSDAHLYREGLSTRYQNDIWL